MLVLSFGCHETNSIKYHKKTFQVSGCPAPWYYEKNKSDKKKKKKVREKKRPSIYRESPLGLRRIQSQDIPMQLNCVHYNLTDAYTLSRRKCNAMQRQQAGKEPETGRSPIPVNLRA